MSRKEGELLRPVRVEDVPLREVSGVCLRRDLDGAKALIAIGDCVAVAAWTSLPSNDEDTLSWETAPLSGLAGTRLPVDDPQIEAVCADGAGRVLLLQESPPRVELVDPVRRRVVCSVELEIPAGHALAAAWADPEGSGGEGAVLLANGHLLVAKEKAPAAFIEFGPPEDAPSGFHSGSELPDGAAWPAGEGERTFVALATWMPDKRLKDGCQDFSDLEVGPDGRLFVLSDKSAALARLMALPATGGTAEAERIWELGKLDGKPEGLAFTRNGRPIVALDTRKAGHNLVLFEPAIAT